MKLKLIETPEYILAVSDEDIKESNYGLITSAVMTYEQMIKEWGEPLGRKIIAYQPKSNTSELDLPLLPEIVDNNDVDKITKVVMNKWVGTLSKMKISPEEIDEITEEHSFYYLQGYKAATKVYSEEDLRRAIGAGLSIGYGSQFNVDNIVKEVENIIQSLKTPKAKWFVAETETVKSKYIGRVQIGTTPSGEPTYINEGYEEIQRLKTTTINGKTYLVGKYITE
jgi:hypothetical protein